MGRLPRLALAIPDGAPALEPVLAGLAMVAGLSARGLKVQHFGSQARPINCPLLNQLTGLPGRHLDAWLMSPETCRQVFLRGAIRSELSIVEGPLSTLFDRSPVSTPEDSGRLGPLVRALDLPVVAVLPCDRLEGFHIPGLACEADAFLLDGLSHPADFEAIKSWIQLTWRKPVLGAVEALPEIRESLRDASPLSPVPTQALERMAQSFLRFADLKAISEVCTSRPFTLPPRAPGLPFRQGFRVAYAMDDAFGAYFPDTLELLEVLGADLLEFSPLRDEDLPANLDLVMIGCGHPEREAATLAGNHSLISALKQHVCQGRRLYAEGGGAAYLGRLLHLPDRVVPGAGILPFDAKFVPEVAQPRPVSHHLTRDSWLGLAGTEVRGYRSSQWELTPAPDPTDCPARSGTLTEGRDLYFRHHAIGSLVHIHPAALPELASAFAGYQRSRSCHSTTLLARGESMPRPPYLA